METSEAFTETTADLIERFRLAIREERTDEAATLLDDLRRQDPVAASRPVYSTMLAIARDDPLGALQALGDVDDAPELRAVCLRLLDDPNWEGLAESLARDSEDSGIRAAMRHLLGRDAELS
jgi:hypothetical protein